VSEPITQMQITVLWRVVPCGLIKRNLLDQLSGSWTLNKIPPPGRILPTQLCRFTAIVLRTSNRKGKDNGKVYLRIGHKVPKGVYRYFSILYLTSALDGVCGQRHASAALPPGKRPRTHCIGGWAGPRVVLDACRKSRPYRDSIPGQSSQ
jgi:hypothetical protein